MVSFRARQELTKAQDAYVGQQQKRAEAHGAAAKDGPGHPWTVRKQGGSPMGQQKNGDLTDKAGNLIWILI